MTSVDELHTSDQFSWKKHKNPGEFEHSVFSTTVIIKLQLFKVIIVFIPKWIGMRKVCVGVLFMGHISHHYNKTVQNVNFLQFGQQR